MTEFVIKDLADGSYLSGGGYWRSDGNSAIRYSYLDACRVVIVRHETSTLRIVEAPPKRLTDEECWAWLKAHDAYLSYAANNGQWFVAVNGVRAYADTPLDAIRAAAAKCSK